jgi:RNA polymerase sigma-70 factor, ECF subfamily
VPVQHVTTWRRTVCRAAALVRGGPGLGDGHAQRPRVRRTGTAASVDGLGGYRDHVATNGRRNTPPDDVVHAQTHDVDAFLEVRPNLLHYATRTLGSATDAEDIIQEVWIRWWQRQRDITSARAWLYTVTRNLTLDRLRERRNRGDAALDQITPLASSPELPTRAEAVDEVAEGVRLILQSLSPLERTVFVLHEGLVWTYTDISRLLARSEQSIRQLMHRARVGLAAGRLRYATSRRQIAAVSEAYLDACAGGELSTLLSELAPDVSLVPSGRRLVQDRLIHDVAGIVLVEEERLLLCHRRPDLTWYPDVWDVPGSHLLIGEPALACAVRAARKELGVSTVDPKPLAQVTGDDFSLTLIKATVWDGQPRNVKPAEHDAIGFFTRDQAARLDLANRGYLELFDRVTASAPSA